MSHQKAPNADFHHLFHTNLDRDMLEICVFQLSYNIARNLAVLSLVYHMYANLAYNAWQICFYFFAGYVCFAIMSFFSAKVIERIGLKHTIGLRALTVAIYFIALIFFLTTNFWLSILLIIPFNAIRAFGTTASQVAYDTYLSHHLTKKNRGEALAWLQIAIMVSTVLAPIIGGFLTKYYGFNITIMVACVFFAISYGVLLLTPDEKFELPYKLKAVAYDTFHNTPKALYAAEIGRTFFDSVLFLIWPLFLVLVIGDIAEIGMIAGLSSGVAMGIAFWVGKQIDKSDGSLSTIVKHGAWRSSVINLVRGLWWEPLSLGIVDAISKINDQTIKLPYDVEFYRWVKEKNSLERTHIRQILFQNIYAIAFLIYFLIFLAFPEAPAWIFFVIFVSSAMGLMLCTQISKVKTTAK